MASLSEVGTCHVTGCAETAERRCDRCERPYCEHHLQRITLARRLDPDEGMSSSWQLGRAPTLTETYMLCPQCRNKPFAGKPGL